MGDLREPVRATIRCTQVLMVVGERVIDFAVISDPGQPVTGGKVQLRVGAGALGDCVPGVEYVLEFNTEGEEKS